MLSRSHSSRVASGWPVPGPAVVRAVVEAAHATGLSVVAHALRVDMVRRAIDGGVDELAHTPTERLPDDLVEQIAEARVAVVSTLQTFFSAGSGRAAAANAAALHRAGVVLRYGTDLGNDGTVMGVDPRELDRLADAGLGRLGALRAATELGLRARACAGAAGTCELASRLPWLFFREIPSPSPDSGGPPSRCWPTADSP